MSDTDASPAPRYVTVPITVITARPGPDWRCHLTSLTAAAVNRVSSSGTAVVTVDAHSATKLSAPPTGSAPQPPDLYLFETAADWGGAVSGVAAMAQRHQERGGKSIRSITGRR
jgi:hypothetical protein